MRKTTDRLIIVLVATLTLSAAQAIAQPQPQQHQDAQAVSQKFDRQTLGRYAAVSGEVGKIQSEFAQKLQTAPDQEQAMEVQREATRKMASIIEAQGLDVPTFNKISYQIQVDPALRQEVEQIGTRGD
jgi:GTP1/Obg family GTP-binding protein